MSHGRDLGLPRLDEQGRLILAQDDQAEQLSSRATGSRKDDDDVVAIVLFPPGFPVPLRRYVHNPLHLRMPILCLVF